MVEGVSVTFCLTGGVGAALVPSWLLALRQEYGWQISPVVSRSAENFVTTVALGAICGNRCYSDDDWYSSDGDILHRRLGSEADLVVVAPTSLNSMVKFSLGICDNLVSAIVGFTEATILIVPAVSQNIFGGPACRRAVSLLRSDGIYVMEPGSSVVLHDLSSDQGGMPDYGAFEEYLSTMLENEL